MLWFQSTGGMALLKRLLASGRGNTFVVRQTMAWLFPSACPRAGMVQNNQIQLLYNLLRTIGCIVMIKTVLLEPLEKQGRQPERLPRPSVVVFQRRHGGLDNG